MSTHVSFSVTFWASPYLETPLHPSPDLYKETEAELPKPQKFTTSDAFTKYKTQICDANNKILAFIFLKINPNIYFSLLDLLIFVF